MKKRKLKKGIIYSLYGISFAFLIGCLFFIESLNNVDYVEKDYQYVEDAIFDNNTPVIADTKTIIKPFVDQEVSILVNYYDFKSSEDEQKKSLIYYENTYLQNSGIVYGKKDEFDVMSILDGTVVEVKEDKTLGTIVQIRHSNEVISTYQGIKEVNLKVDDTVEQGQIIGKSSNSNMLKEYGNALLFELIINGNTVNPEDYYNKNINELK